MLLTRESDYALRFLRELADGQMRSVSDICAGSAVPLPFAYKILKKMEKMGLVKITRGARGGCSLTGDLNAYTLYDLLEAMGDRQYVNACMEPDYECSWQAQNEEPCTVHCTLCRIQKDLEGELRKYTLAGLMKKA